MPSADASHIELDELWRRATGGDPMDLASLADREGAIGLLVGLEQGGDTGLTALHAMPYADDAELAMQRLGEIALQSDGDTQRQVIDAMLAVAGHLVSAREVLDAPGLQSAAAALLELLHSGKATKEVRASAVSTLRLLVDRRVVDPASIPADFDSP